MPLFFYTYIALPLVYISEKPQLTRSLRLTLLFGIFVSALASVRTRNELKNNFANLPADVKKLGLVLVIGMLASTLRTSQPLGITLFGLSPEFLGVVSWVVFLSLALLFKNVALQLLISPITLTIASIILVTSLITDNFYIQHGLRVAGVMFQPTSMAIFAVLAATLSLYHLFSNRARTARMALVCLLLSLVTVMLCQSRLGYVLLALVLSAWALVGAKQRLQYALMLMLATVAIVAIPLLNPSYFSRFATDSVERGISYRLDLYVLSGKDLLGHNLLLGNGPSSLPEAINNINAVPEEVAKSLHTGYIFLSTHDLYFDFAYFYGLTAALILVLITLLATYRTIRKSEDPNQKTVWLLLLAVLIANALFNIPSLELTSLYFVAIIALIGSKNTTKHTAK